MEEIPYAMPCEINEKEMNLPVSKEIIPHKAIIIHEINDVNEVIVSHRYRYPEINFKKYYTICFLFFCCIPLLLIVINYFRY